MVCSLASKYYWIALNLPYNENKLHKTLYYWSRDMLNFYFWKRVWEWFLHLILYMIFQEKCFSCYSSNFIIWLPLLLEILSNRCIAIVYVPGWDIINFEIYLIFLIKRFLYMTQKSRQKFKYLNNKRAFNSSQDWVGPKRLLLPVFSSCNF